jgi:hypothetical protein
MDDEVPELSPPYVSYRTLMTQVERMESEGVPSKIDKHFLSQMAGGTQNHFRQALRSLGLIGEEARPTQVLRDLVNERQGRAALFAKIMADRFPALYQLPPDTSKSDFFAVLESYGVKSAEQQRKILTFYVAAADAAGLPVSTHIRPTKSHTGPRRPVTRRTRKTSGSSGSGGNQAGPTGSEENGTPIDDVLSDEAMRSMYFKVLLKKAERDDADSDLYDRIELLVRARAERPSGGGTEEPGGSS